jgi:SH3 domain-containing protein/oxygen tolerance protein BatD
VTGLLLLALVQVSRPELHVSVDQDRVAVGEEIVYTVRAVSHSSDPMDLSIAPINGFEIVSRSERTEVAFSGGPIRTTTLELRLRALRPGRWQIGPARAVQGRLVAEADAVVVDVDPGAAAATAVNPRLRTLMDRAPPPPRGKAAVALVVSGDTVTVGEQVDVVTAAWFPRDLRLQLRRPPTLQPPVIDGVWSYPQAAPAGIAVTRSMGGTTYDLFVAHQVVFPLVAGTIAIPRAMLKYSTPMALQFFSQEERFALTSLPETLVVRPLPTQGRPADFNGAVGSGLKLERRVTPATAHPGEGVAVELALSGEGNSALWPPPDIRWPTSVRAYVDRVDERVSTTDGRLGGIKTFRYLVVPDSAGAVTLPAVSYSYFDLGARAYRSAGLGPAALPVAAGGESAVSVALPPELLTASAPAGSWRIAHTVPDWVWVAILVLPPLLILPRRSLRHRRRPVRPAPETGLRAAEETLDAVVRGLVPDPDHRSRTGLAAAVRAAGADAETASRIAAVRERLLARRYGPPGIVGEDTALTTEVDELVRRLGGSLREWRGRGAALGITLVLFGSGLNAQAPPPERLYESGALRAAAEGFTRQVEVEPAVAAHWYDLGATYYRLGSKGRAAAAWIRARRLDPREGTIGRALRLTPPPDGTSARWLWTAPVTPEELLLLGALAWLAGWVGWVLRPRARDRWLILLVFSAAAMFAGFGLRTWYRRPIAIALDQTTLRLSPHGRAPSVGVLDAGAAVRILRQERGWALVRVAGSREGWVDSEAIAAIGG